MEGGVDPQRGFQHREPELDIPPLQSEGVQFEAIFFEPTYTTGPSSQPSFTEPLHTEIPHHQSPHAFNHASWMDLSTKISYLSTHMEELVVVGDTWF